MCGIIGYVGPQGTDVTTILLDGLSKLEYRGYDSAGIAVLTSTGTLELHRRAGKIANLVATVEADAHSGEGTLGLGHTRWATHGRPSDINAHPHPDCTGMLTVVHNGIIENYAELRQELELANHTFRSETDTEVLAHLIEDAYFGEAQHDLTEAVRLALQRVTGSYAIGVVSQEHPDLLVGARCNGPLIVGLGEQEQFLASDIPAILKHTRRIIILDEGEIVTLHPSSVSITKLDGTPVQREPLTIEWDAEAAEKGGYPHFVLKEIFEQPDALRRAFLGRMRDGQLHLAELASMQQAGLLDQIQRIIIVAELYFKRAEFAAGDRNAIFAVAAFDRAPSARAFCRGRADLARFSSGARESGKIQMAWRAVGGLAVSHSRKLDRRPLAKTGAGIRRRHRSSTGDARR